MGTMTLRPHVTAMTGKQRVSDIIVSFVHAHRGFEEVTFPNEKSIQPF